MIREACIIPQYTCIRMYDTCITSKRPPRERELLGNQAKKSALVKRFLLHF